MRLSIIVPAINEAENLQSLLASLTYDASSFEVIIADGGSTDSTAQVVSLSPAKLLSSSKGRASQMNAGAAIASGDVLCFLHADTQLPEQALADINNAIQSGGRWGRFDIRLSGGHWMFRIIERLINWRSAITGIATGDQGIFVRRSLFQSLNGYADIPLMEDVELSRRLRRLARPALIHRPLITSSRRWEENGIIRTIFLMWGLRLAYFVGVPPHVLAKLYR